jgi:hypothetical protein
MRGYHRALLRVARSEALGGTEGVDPESALLARGADAKRESVVPGPAMDPLLRHNSVVRTSALPFARLTTMYSAEETAWLPRTTRTRSLAAGVRARTGGRDYAAARHS